MKPLLILSVVCAAFALGSDSASASQARKKPPVDKCKAQLFKSNQECLDAHETQSRRCMANPDEKAQDDCLAEVDELLNRCIKEAREKYYECRAKK